MLSFQHAINIFEVSMSRFTLYYPTKSLKSGVRILLAQQRREANGDHIRWQDHGTFPSSQNIPLDGTGLHGTGEKRGFSHQRNGQGIGSLVPQILGAIYCLGRHEHVRCFPSKFLGRYVLTAITTTWRLVQKGKALQPHI